MIGASKILTVSYGTFSCTLEGFEDPFNTMRAIAEYFRDLAAEDRYFGAEPPTPDAAMLHKIAEREIQRRVEAKIDGNGVILRAGDVDTAQMPQPALERAAPQLAAPSVMAADSGDTDSVMARLSRLRDAQPEAAKAAAIDEVYTEDEHAEATAPAYGRDMAADDSIAAVLAHLHEDQPAPDTTDADADATLDDIVESADAKPWLDTSDTALVPAQDSITADILPEDSSEWPLVGEMDFSDFDLVTPLATTDTDAPIDSQSDIPDQFDDADASWEQPSDAPSAAETTKYTLSDDEILASTLGAMIDPEGDDEAENYAEADIEPDVAETLIIATPDAAPVEAAPVDEIAEPAADSQQPLVAAETALPEMGTEDRLQRARARVIKIRRIDTSLGTIAQPTPESVEPEPIAPAPSLLTPEAEAELQRELAALESEVTVVTPAMPTAETAAPQANLPETAPADDAVNRLISQTNTVMEGPENKRRLAAIAHLKAAVAATFADRKANPGATQPGPAERMDPYRDDLDRVVRPRRPALVTPSSTEAAAHTPRPQIDTRPAPLVLVSEQRIDRTPTPAAVPASPVRPRRVTTTILAGDATNADQTDDEEDGYLSADDVNNIFSDPSQPFPEFAERLGASSMPEMLEAAAAYCALHLGREQFTRPLLLQQIADLPDGDAISREDCLRGFGTLLRDGRIEKIKRGQFKLADHSRYLAEGKRQAG